MIAIMLGALLGADGQPEVKPPADATPPREFSTDRPDKTESPYTVAPGRFHFEMDVATYAIDRSRDIRTTITRAVPFNLKAGLTPSTDIQLVVEPLIRERVKDRNSGVVARRRGFGDVTVRLKHNLWGNDGGATALAVMPFVTLPTSTNGVGVEAAEFGLIVPLAVSLSERVGLGLMTEVDLVREDGDYVPVFINSATIGVDVTDRLGTYVEAFTEKSSEAREWVVTLDGGLTYAVTEDLQLDAGANVGLTEAADDLLVFLGVSRRF